MTVPRPDRRLLLATLALALGTLPACRGAAGRAGRGEPATGLPEGAAAPTPAEPRQELPSDVPLGETDAGPYAGDERFLTLATGWPERVKGAGERLELVTGLSFRDRAAPRVVLAALGDERTPWRLEAEIVEGRRRTVAKVNVEPLVVGAADPDRTLLHALAAVAVAGGPRDAKPPPWFVVYVGCLAAGDLADRIDRAARAAARGGPALRVDPGDPAQADATAYAAGLLLAERSTPIDVRRFVALVADGEDAGHLLPTWIHDDSGTWTGPGREILEDAASRADLRGDRAVAEARRALETLGSAGLDESLAASEAAGLLTDDARAEAEALRLRAALALGDGGAARRVLERAPPVAETLGRLVDPGSYELMAAQAASLEGGDPARAWGLLARFERDFPRHPARPEALDLMSSLLGRVPPELEETILARVLAERGPEGIDDRAAARRARALLADHRPGAAARFLALLGRRAEDGDLASVVGEIHAAQTDPDAASLAASRARVDAWLTDRTADAEADVVDGGGVAATVMAERLPGLEGDLRAAAIRVLVRAGGLARAVGLLSPAWTADPDRLGPDLEVLASVSGYADLRRTVEALHPAVKTDARASAEWERACLGLDPERLAADDGLLARLLSPEFTVRRDAFEAVAGPEGAGATPALLARFSKDPATLLRRLAVLSAGRAGLGAIAREGLRDPSWIVRQAACAAVVDAGATDAAYEVAGLLTAPDPDERVREAAATALLRFAQKDVRWVRPLVSILRVGDPPIADGVAAALPDLPPAAVARAVVAELGLEALGPGARLDRGVLFRLFVAYRRASGVDAGYDPSLSVPEVRAIVARLRDQGQGGGDGRARTGGR